MWIAITQITEATQSFLSSNASAVFGFLGALIGGATSLIAQFWLQTNRAKADLRKERRDRLSDLFERVAIKLHAVQHSIYWHELEGEDTRFGHPGSVFEEVQLELSMAELHASSPTHKLFQKAVWSLSAAQGEERPSNVESNQAVRRLLAAMRQELDSI